MDQRIRSAGDEVAPALFCEALAPFGRTGIELRRDGFTVINRRRGDVHNAIWTIYRQAGADADMYGNRLGLNPRASASVSKLADPRRSMTRGRSSRSPSSSTRRNPARP